MTNPPTGPNGWQQPGPQQQGAPGSQPGWQQPGASGWQQPGPQQPGPPPNQEPYELPDPAMTPRQRRWLPVAVAVGIVALVVVVVIIVTSISGSADAGDYGLDEAVQDSAPEVSQLAADAALAADEVDVEAGLALMCQAPSAAQINALKGGISAANGKAGGDAEKSLTITDAQQKGDTGSFVVQVQGQGALDKYGFTATAEVQKSGQGWCISKIDVND